jgi:hypothetical protein
VGGRGEEEITSGDAIRSSKSKSSVAATVTDPTLCRCTVRSVTNVTAMGIFFIYGIFNDNVGSSEFTAANYRIMN